MVVGPQYTSQYARITPGPQYTRGQFARLVTGPDYNIGYARITPGPNYDGSQFARLVVGPQYTSTYSSQFTGQFTGDTIDGGGSTDSTLKLWLRVA